MVARGEASAQPLEAIATRFLKPWQGDRGLRPSGALVYSPMLSPAVSLRSPPPYYPSPLPGLQNCRRGQCPSRMSLSLHLPALLLIPLPRLLLDLLRHFGLGRGLVLEGLRLRMPVRADAPPACRDVAPLHPHFPELAR